MPKPRKKSANNSNTTTMLTSPNLVQLNTPKNMENMDSKTDKIRNPLNNKPIIEDKRIQKMILK